MSDRIAIIGAGCSGIAAIKFLTDAGLEHIVCYEQNADIGGNWLFEDKSNHSSICETTHIISSKKLSSFPDYPMPEDYPDYPSHRELLSYFDAFTKDHGLKKYIQFNTKVDRIEKTKDEKWIIKLDSGQEETFDYLLLANGHHSVPRMPDLPGKFSGRYLHAHDYKSNESFKNQNVLIIGAGNSACDCAVEISRVAKSVSLSMRRPHYIIPKFFMGIPTDVFNANALWIPKFLRDKLFKYALRLQIGKYKYYGLEEPDFAVTADHPTVNSELLYMLRHGKVKPRKAITQIDGNLVRFADGHEEDFDAIIAATGYKIATPFFDPDFLDYSEADRVELYLKMFHPSHPSLIFIGLVQPQGAIWPLSSQQSKLAAQYILGNFKWPKDIRKRAEKEADLISSQFLKRKRHTIEVDFHEYIKKLISLTPKFSIHES